MIYRRWFIFKWSPAKEFQRQDFLRPVEFDPVSFPNTIIEHSTLTETPQHDHSDQADASDGHNSNDMDLVGDVEIVEEADFAGAERPPLLETRTAIFLQLFFLILSLLVIILSFVMQTSDDRTVNFPGMGPMPESCSFKRILGIGCPGCGMTRSFINISGGRLVRAWHLNPGSFLMYLMVASQIPYRIWQLFRIRKKQPLIEDTWIMWTSVAMAVVIVTQWLFKLATGNIV